MLILTYMFKHDTFYIFHPYFHKERGFGVPIFYLTGIIKKIDEFKGCVIFEDGVIIPIGNICEIECGLFQEEMFS